MSENSIREELWELVDEFVNSDHDGDMKPLADAILASPAIRRIQAAALRKFRQRLINDQVKSYGIVLPDIHTIVDALDTEAALVQNGLDDD